MKLRHLLLPLVLLLCACARKEVPYNEWFSHALTHLAGGHDKWTVIASGTSNSKGGHLVASLVLRGATPSEALTELKARLIDNLRRAGFDIADADSGKTDAYTFKITSRHSVGSLTASTTRTASDRLSVDMLFVQEFKRE
jgi:hypothetical protein